ncbi:hypothetical protein ARALYDRAFT_475592 [Arabidopsis lyrata subsp. lyrata]|uniref:Uncharacterized protein n=1 Tax=Arabidopsis lyrata subsp. lyrata TaxID=81972 RepID=D7KRF4_ARALL|nr:hypothetical protein ARALYDRAFT_475592 [Arabidopsis lyrata subsp. lyrata]
MVNTCRISFISSMILLLFINQSALSSSVRIGLQEGRDLVHHRTLDEIERADKARLRVEIIGRSYARKGQVTESIIYPRAFDLVALGFDTSMYHINPFFY